MDNMRQVTFAYVALAILVIAGTVEGTSIQQMDEIWGEQLMNETEKIASEQYGMDKMIVMSALGTKQYYGRLGYEKDGVYVSKPLV